MSSPITQNTCLIVRSDAGGFAPPTHPANQMMFAGRCVKKIDITKKAALVLTRWQLAIAKTKLFGSRDLNVSS